MSSPIFDSTFGTGRFRREEATKSPEPQDVRQALELQLFDLVELARDTRSDKGGEAKWVHPCGALVKEFAKRIAALAQSDAGPFPQPRRNDAGEPCGECHLQPGETCDVCGALAQSDAGPVVSSCNELRAFLNTLNGPGATWLERMAAQEIKSLMRERAALAQSDAEPVACPVCKGSGFSGVGSGYGDVCGECGGQKYINVPPRHDASAGLIEAAKIAEEQYLSCDAPRPSCRQEREMTVLWSDDLSKAEISRIARATIAALEKRIAELEADASGLIEAAEWHEAKALAHSARNFSDQRIVSWHRDCALALRSRAADRSA